MTEHQSVYATAALPAMTERELLQCVVELLRWLGFLVYHTQHSIHSAAGFYDIVAIGHGRCLLIELKTERGVLSDAQRLWAEVARACPGVEYYELRPDDWHDGTAERIGHAPVHH